MAKEKTSAKLTANSKKEFGAGSKKKRTSIGKSKNSRPKDKNTVRESKGHK